MLIRSLTCMWFVGSSRLYSPSLLWTFQVHIINSNGCSINMTDYNTRITQKDSNIRKKFAKVIIYPQNWPSQLWDWLVQFVPVATLLQTVHFLHIFLYLSADLRCTCWLLFNRLAVHIIGICRQLPTRRRVRPMIASFKTTTTGANCDAFSSRIKQLGPVFCRWMSSPRMMGNFDHFTNWAPPFKVQLICTCNWSMPFHGTKEWIDELRLSFRV